MRMTVIRGGRLLDIERQAAPYLDILLDGSVIKAVGPPGMAAPENAILINAANRLLHPGLINGHTHSPGNLAKGVAGNWNLEALLTAAPWVTGHRMVEEKYLSALIGAAEMLLKGCTACYDLAAEFPTPSPEGIHAVAQAYSDAGMRAVVAPMVADLSFYQAIPGLIEALPEPHRKDVERFRLEAGDASLQNMASIIKNWPEDHDRIRPAIAPTIPLHCHDDFMTGCRDLARDHGLGLHSHVGETKFQSVSAFGRYGKTMTAHIDGLGLLGPDFTAAHGVWLDDDDMMRLGGHGASVSHNPGSNALLGSGIADARRMIELGINLAIGTDGANCCDHQNMYEAMRAASYMSHVRGPDREHWLTPQEIVKAATEGSAKALGFDRVGRIEPGYQADIVFLDLRAINWIPLNNPVNQLVHTEDGSSVQSVMVGGKLVVKNRRLVNIDLAKLGVDAERARARLEAVNKPNKMLCDQLERLNGSFCAGLSKRPYHVNRYAAFR